VAVVFAIPLAVPQLHFIMPGLNGAFWFLLKVAAYIYVFMWLRFTLPRYRFDQLMHLGWYILIPLAIVNVFAVGIAMLLESHGWNRWLALISTTIITLAFAILLVRWHDQRTESASSPSLAPDSYAG
jgi:hypothetical protein